MFRDCQVSLENNTNLTTAFKGDVFKIFGKGGEPYMGGDLAFYWGTWKPIRNHVIGLRSEINSSFFVAY